MLARGRVYLGFVSPLRHSAGSVGTHWPRLNTPVAFLRQRSADVRAQIGSYGALVMARHPIRRTAGL